MTRKKALTFGNDLEFPTFNFCEKFRRLLFGPSKLGLFGRIALSGCARKQVNTNRNEKKQQRARRERRLARAPDVARPQAGDEHVAAAPDVVRRVEPGLVRRGARRRRGPGECHCCCGDVGGISSLPRRTSARRAGFCASPIWRRRRRAFASWRRLRLARSGTRFTACPPPRPAARPETTGRRVSR